MLRLRIALYTFSIAILVAIASPHVVPVAQPYLGTVAQAAAVLIGDSPPSDLVQDMIGMRALWSGADPYPTLGPAMATLGLQWNVRHASTHPPSAFLLVAPVAWLPWPLAAATWGWLGLVCLAASLYALGYGWRTSLLGVILGLLWPPISLSLGQLTLIWLFGVAMAERWRDQPALAGACIAMASLPKFFPALLLLPYLHRRQWGAVAGFGGIWVAAFALTGPAAWMRYIEVNAVNGVEQAARLDNAALLPALGRMAGALGVAAGMLLLLALLWRGRWAALSVALLPIAWVYSLAPLLPSLLAARGVAAPLALAALVIPVLAPPWGPPGAGWHAMATACAAGAALFHVDAQPTDASKSVRSFSM